MMSELLVYLEQLENVYRKYYDNDKRHEEASKIWTQYYKRSREQGVSLYDAYTKSLMYENESYIINQEPIRKNIDDKEVSNIVKKLIEANLENIEEKRLISGIKEEDAEKLLEWDVENTRKILGKMGIDIAKNSLNGFCELGQALSILPFEVLDLDVTKNRASICFGYPYNHAFGTVSIPIIDNDKVILKTYLIDTTYRQFFSTVRCNVGRYYLEENDLDIETTPAPGFFVEDKEFAKKLMGNGYIELIEETAKKYGEPFYLSSLKLGEKNKRVNYNYLEPIMDTSCDYSMNLNDINSFNCNFPIEVDEVKKI